MFKKGQSGNKAGRPTGAKDKVQTELKQRIKTFLDGNFDDLQESYKMLDPVQKLAFYEKMVKYCVPVKSSQDLRLNFEDLSESQIDEIIEKLLNKNQ